MAAATTMTWIPIDEAAARLGISEARTYRWAKTVATRRLDGRTFVRVADVMRYQARRDRWLRLHGRTIPAPRAIPAGT